MQELPRSLLKIAGMGWGEKWGMEEWGGGGMGRHQDKEVEDSLQNLCYCDLQKNNKSDQKGGESNKQ
jgi:hypothetical protein